MEKIVTLVSKEAIDRRVAELAAEISKDYAGKNPVFVCVLKGAFIFASDLMRSLTIEAEIDFMDVSSYGKGIKPSSSMSLVLDLQDPVKDRDVIIVEDIADTGRSIDFLIKRLADLSPKSVKVCAFLDKPGSRVIPHIAPDYCGFAIPDKFVVGYGLDFNQKYRHLPYVGILSFDE